MSGITIQQAMDQAVQRHRAGQLAEAEAIYRQVLAREPNYSGALHLLGLLAFQTGNSQAALELIGRGIAVDGNVAEYHLNLGVVLSGLGRLGEAIEAFGRAARLRPDTAEAHCNLGDVLRRRGRLDEAAAACRRAIELRPNYPEAHLNLGNALQEKGEIDAAVGEFEKTIGLRPDWAEGHFNLGNALAKQGKPDEAIAAHRRALALKPDFAQAMTNLADALRERGKEDEALPLLRQAAALRPDITEAQLGVATILAEKREWDGAIAAYRQLIARRPDLAEAHCGLGWALRGAGDRQAAMGAFEQAAKVKPEYANAYLGMSHVLSDLGYLEDSAAAARRAVSLDPKQARAHGRLGWALCARGELDAAIESMKTAVELAPEDWGLHNDRGIVLGRLGKTDEAIACYDRALALKPDAAVAASNRAYAHWFDPQYDTAQIIAEHRRWYEGQARGLQESSRGHDNDRDPERKLRIGYVSPDLRNHVVGRNVLPLLREHDRGEFEVFCYSNTMCPDGMTRLFRAQADHWRDITPLEDAAAAELIRADRIDVLVDLSLHMAMNRLLTFARKPAPVQVTFAGYPGTTGLPAIDWRITDPRLDPDDETGYVERAHRLPDSFWCYDPAAMEWEDDAQHRPPAPGELAAEENGYVTFGCLNNFRKVNRDLLRLWGRVVRGTPGSRLRLLAPPGEGRRWTLEVLAEAGIGAERIEFVPFVPRPGYLREFGKIDVCLDTLPYNGHATSLDSMWMGVPVVTRVGRTIVGRAGLSQLFNVGLCELAGEDDDQFVKIATELAGDVPRLRELRRTLRRRMLDSPLTDGRRFARNIEAGYRAMWRQWCQGGSS